jgi:hypothetical protein
MSTYTVHFRNSTAWASHDIKADTPENALALARKFVDDDSLDLWFEPYDLSSEVNEIVVSDDAGNELAFWFDEDASLRLAAQDLLDALEQAVAALNEAPRFAVPDLDTDSYEIATICDKAVAKAKGGAL